MHPAIRGDRLSLPRERYLMSYHAKVKVTCLWLIDTPLFSCSLEVAIFRLKEQEAVSRETSLNFKACPLFDLFSYEYAGKFCYLLFQPSSPRTVWLDMSSHFYQLLLQNLAKDDYERNFVSAVVPPGEVGVRFDDVGALEDVKDALNELVILPMRRPELFSRGNLLRVSMYCCCHINDSFEGFSLLFFFFSLGVSANDSAIIVSPAKEFYFSGLPELGRHFLPRHWQQKQGQIL